MSQLDECPVCNASLPSNQKSREANEAHIAACISQQMESNLTMEEPPLPEQDSCPVCQMSFNTKEYKNDMAACEAHVQRCLEDDDDDDDADEAEDVSSTRSEPPGYANGDVMHKTFSGIIGDGNDLKGVPEKRNILTKYAPPKGPPPSKSISKAFKNGISEKSEKSSLQQNNGRRPSLFQRLSNKLTIDDRSPQDKHQATLNKADALMLQKWGPSESVTREMVMRYWVATRMKQHWEYLREQHPKRFKRYISSGYMEPIPTRWVQDRRLAYPYPEYSTYENAAEERLYYFLNNGTMPDGSKHAPLGRPLNVNRDMYTILRRGNERNARQVMIDRDIVVQFHSPADVFNLDTQIKSHEYSAQVPNVVYQARRNALHELADGIIHGTDHLETMLLLDISSSMTWNPHSGMVGPDGVRRYHDQPANIRLVEHLVHRVLHHMIPRAQKEHPAQRGIETVTFSSWGTYVGQLSARNFRGEWGSKIQNRLGGGTQVMQGWQMVKNTYFQHQNQRYGHGRFDEVYGWQPTPGMPKLSLLVFLDGEAGDMDEFELELLGETWAYVTIALGMSNTQLCIGSGT